MSFLDYAADGKFLIGCGCGPELFIWDASTGAEVKRLSGHQASVVKFAVTGDNDQVIYCSDTSLHPWSTDAISSTRLINKELPSGLRELVANESGEWITILAKDGQIECWELDDEGELCKKWSAKEQQGKTLAVSPDQKRVACGGRKHTIKILTA